MTAPRRVLLKLSGEAFADPEKGYGIDPVTVERVAKEIVEAHGGDVRALSPPGGGAEFVLGLPLASAGEPVP